MIALGISMSDFVPARGHVDPGVYERVDYVEFGGFGPPAIDAGIAQVRASGAVSRVNRHLTSAELPAPLEATEEARRIAADLRGLPSEYFVTDFGYWRLGGRNEENLWLRPCALTSESVTRIADNARAMTAHLDAPVLPENPFVLCPRGDMSMTDFMASLAERGALLCFDVGHFYAWCENAGVPVGDALDRLPYHAFILAHIAGLSRIEYAGRTLYIDNHKTPPLSACLELLAEVVKRAPGLRWVTYEAEMAPTDVQHVGLDSIERIVR
jgi:uncharacterized protein (UPF0276 family)